MAAGENLSVCDHYIQAAASAYLEWDGENTADFILSVIRRTGESASEVLEEAMEKHMKERR